jgi:hypothetical protein
MDQKHKTIRRFAGGGNLLDQRKHALQVAVSLNGRSSETTRHTRYTNERDLLAMNSKVVDVAVLFQLEP